jgi:hypothetical protein
MSLLLFIIHHLLHLKLPLSQTLLRIAYTHPNGCIDVEGVFIFSFLMSGASRIILQRKNKGKGN